MTRIVHLTDLHFGQDRADLAGPVAEAVRRLAPDLVIAGGDLTHRARAGQFARARAWLAGLGAPVLAVPGNHDMPLVNLPLRLIAPFRAFRAGAGPVRPGPRAVGRAWVVCANTADPWVWRRGRLPGAQLRILLAELAAAPPGLVPVLVAHHPFAEPAGFTKGETRGAAAALPRLAKAGLQVLLTGHLHHWTVGLGLAPDRPAPVLQVQTGTALCARAGERDHGFAVLDIDDAGLTVTPWTVDAGVRPQARAPLRALRRGGLWHRIEAGRPG